MNKLDAHDLRIQTDDNGFILGQSFIGDTITNEANVWREVRTEFSSLSMNRSVRIDKGILFTPEAASLVLTSPRDSFSGGVVGKSVRTMWKDGTFFVGTVRTASFSATATNEGVKERVTLNVVGLIHKVNNYVLDGFTAPQESVAARVARAAGTTVGITAIDCDRTLAARPESNIKLLTVLQEASDAQLAKFYVDKNDNLVMDGSTPTGPVAVFSDDHSVPNHLEYNSVQMGENPENTITGVVVEAKQDETVTAINRHPSAVVTHEEVYSVDVPTTQIDVNAWAQSFPLLGYVRREPVSIDCQWQDGMEDLELTDLIEVRYKGGTYRAGIKAIRYDIRPDHENGLVWNVRLDLMPGHLIDFTSISAPSEPQSFTATATAPTTVALSWSRPALPNDQNGYMVRWAPGTEAPATVTDGTLLGNYPVTQTSVNHTGRTSNTLYSYSIWAKTPNANVTSNRVTATVRTPEVIPTVPRNLAIAKNSATQHTLTWTAPVAPGDQTAYVIKYRTDGVNPTPTTGTEYVVLPANATSLVAPGLVRNLTYNWAVFGRTLMGAYGPGIAGAQNTNEAIPGAVPNLAVSAPAYNRVELTWGSASPLTDHDHYDVKYQVNAGGPVQSHTSGIHWGSTTGLSATINNAQADSYYDVAVFSVTKGGLVAPMSTNATRTPQGVFGKVWEGDAVWSQSYKGDDTFSSVPAGDIYYGYGDSFNGNQRSMIGWALPGDIQNCLAVDRVILRIYNKHTWNNSGADGWFGYHHDVFKPGTFHMSQGGMATYRMPKPGWIDVDVTGWLGPALKNGAKGVTLGPGPNNSNAYYGYAAGVGGPRPFLRVEYRTIGS